MSNADLMAALRKYLRTVAEFKSATMAPPRPYKYKSLEHFLLTEGQEFTPATTAPPVVRIPRLCFHQSYRLASRRNSRWIYCEGYAINRATGIPLQHAWVVHRDIPNVAHDLAWDVCGRGDVAYLGIAFDTAYVRKVHIASKRKEWSVICAWWMDFPLLTGETDLADVRAKVAA